MPRGKKIKEETSSTEVSIVKSPQELVLEGDPEQQLEFAGKAARALMKRVESKPKKVIINGKQYLEYGDWQTLSRFFGATAGIEWSRRIERDGQYVGYEARAIVYQHGIIISSAEAECITTERNWKGRDEYAVRSMAQTRAAAKALRNAFGWVAELAGYSSTPAEEMPTAYDTTPIKATAIPTVTYDDPEDTDVRQPNDIPTTVEEQRKRIANILEGRGVDWRDGKACKTYVADNTELELVETNYPAIIKILAKNEKD